MAARSSKETGKRFGEPPSWKAFVVLFMGIFAGSLTAAYAFILLIDPYDVVHFSLPIERRIVSIDQRYMYPQIVRSKRFDSLIVGTSTGRLLDPELLGAPFGARFANLAMDSMQAWEQHKMMELFQREVAPPKVLVVALDWIWCREDADRVRFTFRGFPDWLYDDGRWNDYLYLLNSGTAEIAVRLLGYKLGLYRERVRFDGFEVFTPPENQYDLARAQGHIWQGAPATIPDAPPMSLGDRERSALNFPALAWLEAALAGLPASSKAVLAFMPAHIASLPRPGTRDEAVERECKARIDAIARRHGATMIDWRRHSPMTREDSNYWDSLHYRLPIAQRVARDLVAAALHGRESDDGSYVIRVRGNEAAAQ